MQAPASSDSPQQAQLRGGQRGRICPGEDLLPEAQGGHTLCHQPWEEPWGSWKTPPCRSTQLRGAERCYWKRKLIALPVTKEMQKKKTKKKTNLPLGLKSDTAHASALHFVQGLYHINRLTVLSCFQHYDSQCS